MSSSDFYRAFEERYRGPRELIQERLRVYLPYIKPLRQLYPPSPCAIDLGCGRGEWLELLQSEGFIGQGIDLDEGMLAACRTRGLPAIHGDALGYLHTLADASQAVVSGFHIAEHIAFADLQTLVIEALRVLKPGGLLILETPNPENIVVGSNSFYLDPTHKSPLPPNLLSFLPEHYGYARVKVLRLQEASGLDSVQHVQLIDVLAGVSPDYAMVAQKSANPEQMQAFDAAFATVHGIDLETLARRFDERLPPYIVQDEFIARIEAHIDLKLTPLLDQLQRTESSRQAAQERALAAEECARAAQKCAQAAEERIQAAEERTQTAQKRVHAAEELIQAAQERTQAAQKRAHAAEELMQASQERAQTAEQGVQIFKERAQAVQAHFIAIGEERDALRHSLSWRITAPLRGAAQWILRPAQSIHPLWGYATQKASQGSQWLLAPLMHRVLKNPRISYRINQMLMRYPFVHQHLLAIARRSSILDDLSAQKLHGTLAEQPSMENLSMLTYEARAIYAQLKAAASNNKEQH